MIALKDNPIGIDKSIQGIQVFLYDNLADWNIEAYGRADVIDEKPLVFYKKNDYKNVLFINQATKGKLFFIDNETSQTNGNRLVTDVDLIFLLDIKKIKPTITHRADEEIRIKILELLKKEIPRVEIKTTKGTEALKGFDTNLKNMQPYFFLKYSFELQYNINEC